MKFSTAIILAFTLATYSKAANIRGTITQYGTTSDFDVQRQQLLESGSSKCAGAVDTGRSNCETLLWCE